MTSQQINQRVFELKNSVLRNNEKIDFILMHPKMFADFVRTNEDPGQRFEALMNRQIQGVCIIRSSDIGEQEMKIVHVQSH